MSDIDPVDAPDVYLAALLSASQALATAIDAVVSVVPGGNGTRARLLRADETIAELINDEYAIRNRVTRTAPAIIVMIDERSRNE